MKFKYTALGASNKKLEGVLDAESIDAARDELHKMGMSVVGIDEISEEEAASMRVQKAEPGADETIVSYYFLAKDTEGKEVNGTIDSRDPSAAYRRLVTEYQFDVLDLYPQDAADPVAATLKPQFQEWNQALEDEGIAFGRKAQAGTKGELAEESEAMSEEVIGEIDQFIINTKKILKTYPDRYSDAMLSEIDKTLGELERIRASNNLQHITRLCNTIFELVSNPDKSSGDVNQPGYEDYAQTISTLEGSGFISNKFKFTQLHALQKKLERFEKVQIVMNKVRKVFHRGKTDDLEKKYSNTIKKRKARWLSQLTKGLKSKKIAGQVGLTTVISKFFGYISAPNSILRRARKQEMFKSLKAWKDGRRQANILKETQKEKKAEGLEPAEGFFAGTSTPEEAPKKDFSGFFMELDSFVGWLLFFYITYFFLVSFSLERNIGLPKELVLKTLTTPLIVNISIFLIMAHLAFTLKIRLFRSNLLGSLFLFFFSFGIYALVIVNF